MSEYRARMQKIWDHLGGECVHCGATENFHVDHTDHTDKAFTISQNWSRSWDVLVAELEKCQLLCEDCHLIKSQQEGSLAKGWTNESRQVHGTVWSYRKYKCRCEACKAAKAASRKEERDRVRLAVGP